ENRRLRSEVEELRQRTIHVEGMEDSVLHLAAAVEYAAGANYPVVLADIVFIDHTSWLQTLVLLVKEGAVAVNQPAVVSEGLVGRVVVASGPYAKVQLITDRSASVGGMIERTHRQGVVRGAGRGSLELDFVPLQADVRVGDHVLTAGIDGIYPRGISVGTVVAVEPGSELFHTIRLSPSVDFGVLDAVYLIEREPVPETVKEALPDAEP
ncbi:MAG: rod shape-determining protein MreC, partial [Thermoanaerobaculia bacterium]